MKGDHEGLAAFRGVLKCEFRMEAPVSKGTGSTGSPVSGGQSVPV